MNMRILVAEDETALARAVARILEKSNYSVDTVDNGHDAVQYIEAGDYDAAVFDVMMPIMDGITAIETLRKNGHRLPILILSAKSEVDDRVAGLDSGADYYLTKPFSSRELLAAIRAITRADDEVGTCLRFGGITLDRATFELSSAQGTLRLSNKEFQMIELLMSNPGHVIPTERFMEKIWGYDSDAEINVVWVYISYLRKKLTALGADIQIKALRGAGYCLEETK